MSSPMTTSSSSAEHDASIALARQLMAEEAMNSYAHHFQLIQTSDMSNEDFAVLQSIVGNDETTNYDELLQLGDRIGNVKRERYQMVAKDVIEALPTCTYDHGGDETTNCCLVCQCEYETNEMIRILPCQHCFHTSCIDPWLMEQDVCPTCRKSVIIDDDGDKTKA